MINVLKLPDTDVYEKAKKYTGILHIPGVDEQNALEKKVLTPSMPSSADLVPRIDDNDKKRFYRRRGIKDISRPLGWNTFLKTMARLNVPFIRYPKHYDTPGHCRV